MQSEGLRLNGPKGMLEKRKNKLNKVELKISSKKMKNTLTKAQRMTENKIGKIVVDASIHLHRKLGPGLLESVYEATLARRFMKLGNHTHHQWNTQ